MNWNPCTALSVGLNLIATLVKITRNNSKETGCSENEIFFILFLLFTQIAQLSWMGCNGFELYMKIIRVAEGTLVDPFLRFYRRFLCLVGWIFPFVLITICYILHESGYKVIIGKETNSGHFFCWLQPDTVYGAWISLYIGVLVWNSVVFGKIVAVIYQLSRQQNLAIFQQKRASVLLRQIQKTSGLLVSLGITLLLALFVDNSDVAASIFILCNGLLGNQVFICKVHATLSSNNMWLSFIDYTACSYF